MARISTVIIVFFLLLKQPAAIYAQTPTGTRPPVQSSASMAVGEPIPLTRTEQFLMNVPIIGGLIFRFSGQIIPSSSFRIFNFDRTAQKLTAANQALSPFALQELRQNDDFNDPKKYPLQLSARSRLCVDGNDPTTDNGPRTKVSPDVYNSQPIETLNPVIRDSLHLSSYFTGNSLDTQRLAGNHPPTIITENIPGCGSTGNGSQEQDKQVTAQNQNTFEGSNNLLYGAISISVSVIDAIGNFLFPDQTPITRTANVTISQHVPYLDEVKDNMANRQFDQGGLANTFAPAGLDVTKGENNGQQVNAFQVSLPGGGPGNHPVNTFGSKAIVNSEQYMECATTPLRLQGEYVTNTEPEGTRDPNDTCTYSISRAGGSCDASLFEGINNQSGGNGGDTIAPVGYSIPYKNTSCTIDQEAAERIAARIPSMYHPGSCVNEENQFLEYWEDVQNNAVEYGWNPAFILALWLEESGAGVCRKYQMGCTYKYDQQNGSWSKMPENTSPCEQAACVLSYANQHPDDFGNFMCSYSGELGGGNCPDHSGPQGCRCTQFVTNPGFPTNIQLAYTILQDEGGLPSECRMH